MQRSLFSRLGRLLRPGRPHNPSAVLPASGAAWAAGGLAAAALTGSAAFNRTSARRAEAATPPAGSFIEGNGARLHYVERGSGPPVVLLHGNGALLQDFGASGVLGLAAQEHRVIAFDRPGFGYSERPADRTWTPEAQGAAIADALERLGVGPAVIVAHSWGTMVALAMALARPEMVAGLVLVSGYYYPTARGDVGPFSLPAVPLLGGLLAHTLAPLSGRLLAPPMIRASFAPAPVPPSFAAFPLAMTLRPAQIRATAGDNALMIPAAARLRKRYRALQTPIVAMAGEGDLIAWPSRHAARLADEVPSVELRLFSGQGHMLHYTMPDRVVEAIASVWARSGATAAP